jgi:hypothetical protein
VSPITLGSGHTTAPRPSPADTETVLNPMLFAL